MFQPTVQVVIANYNRAQHLRNCLTALQCQKHKLFNIVVADDGSSDDSFGIVYQHVESLGQTRRELHRPYAIKWCSHKHEGFRLAAVRNMGVMLHGASDINVLIDSDMLLNPWAVHRYVAMWKANPDRVVAGAYHYLPNILITADDIRHRWMEVWNGTLPPLRQDERNLQGGPDVRDSWFQAGNLSVDVFADEDKTIPSPLMLLGGNMMIPGHIWEATGGFDESFNKYGGEDAEFSLAVAEAGYPFSYSKQAGAAHQAHSRDPNAIQTGEDAARAYLAKKYPRWWTKDVQPKWDKPGFVFPNERR